MKPIISISRISLIAFFIVLISCNDGKSPESETKNKSIMEKEKSAFTTLINSFEVPAGKLEASIKYWEAWRDFLKVQPGYVSTKLHQSLKNDAKFQLVNVAIWKNPQSFMAAAEKMRNELGVAPVPGLKPNASLYTVVRE